ncbi:serine hydrolase domain-containing protein [Cupriavidus basilensis]
MGWMTGSPPPADKPIRQADMTLYTFPQIRWSFANFRQLVPSTNVRRGDGATSTLPRAERRDIDGITFTPLGRTDTMTWAQSLEANYTDAIVVLHKGQIVYERYFGVMNPRQPYTAMSVTKSFVGTLGAMLVAEGKLDENALVSKYIPELKDTAYGDATVRQVMDMTVGVKVLGELCRSERRNLATRALREACFHARLATTAQPRPWFLENPEEGGRAW